MLKLREEIEVAPSELFSEYEVGELFHANGQRYILTKRDPWKATLMPVYWFDLLADWIIRKLSTT